MKIQLKITRKENCDYYKASKGDIISLDLDAEYLPICIASEIYESNSRTPAEAKKAQAVASRSFALSNVSKGIVMDDTTMYQAFSWKDLSKIPNCVQAVNDTAGEALVYNGQIITAWYSSSNGGQTKRSDQAWSAATPWTVSQPDPWDAAGREKWNITRSMHGVGMSQTGAAYAASIGVTYDKILAFYYPNTEIVGDFGQGTPKEKEDAPEDTDTDADVDTDDTVIPDDGTTTAEQSNEKTNTGIVAFARDWIGQSYWYGTCCYKCTSSLLQRKTAQYPSMYTTARMPQYQRDIKSGKSCADCIGLIKGYHWMVNGEVVYNKNTDVSATGMFNLAKIKGLIKTIPEIPGLLVYKPGHIGIYEGNGNVIEAKGFAYGIIRSKIGDTQWTHWIVDPLISYAGYEDRFYENTPDMPYTAVVVTQSSPLNIWNDTKKTKSLLQVKKGDTLTVTGFADKSGWYTVEKNGVTGVSDGQYLQAV